MTPAGWLRVYEYLKSRRGMLLLLLLLYKRLRHHCSINYAWDEAKRVHKSRETPAPPAPPPCIIRAVQACCSLDNTAVASDIMRITEQGCRRAGTAHSSVLTTDGSVHDCMQAVRLKHYSSQLGLLMM